MIGKFPKPPSIMMNTDIEIIQEIDGEDGVTEVLVYKGKCYYEEAIRRVLDENRQVVELSGLAIVYTNLVFNKAFIRIDGKTRTIYRTSRPRNPDGSVYSTEMELI